MAGRLWITGATGFLGRHVRQHLEDRPGVHTARVNLLAPGALRTALEGIRPSRVLHLAYPGSHGIRTSVEAPFSLLAPLLRMDLNVIEACAEAQVEKLVTVGSVCAYPETVTLPADESQLWAGEPEPVNAAYGQGKRMQLASLRAARQEYGLWGVQVVVSNMYGPGDRSGHVIPSLIARVRKACAAGGPVVVWGRPEVTRSFLYVAEAAEGIVRVLDGDTAAEPLNLTTTEETSMEALVEQIAEHLDYHGRIVFDRRQPTGSPRRLFDNSRLKQALGWAPTLPFEDGLARTIDWSLHHVPLE